MRARAVARTTAAGALLAVVAACSSGGGDGPGRTDGTATTVARVVSTPVAPTSTVAGSTPPSTVGGPGTTEARVVPVPPVLPAGEVAVGEPIEIGPAVKTTIPPPANPAAVPVADPAPVVGPDGAPMFPLTGLAAPSPAAAARPVLTVKIDNAAPARPQTGLDKADVVVEELVEGGQVRFMALFQSQESDPVGPIRSVRPVDPFVLTPFGGLVAYSGGTNRFVNLLRKAPLLDVGSDLEPGAYFRSKDRTAPYNLYSRTTALRAAAPTGARGPSKVFTFGPPVPPVPATRADGIALALSTAISVEWRWDTSAGGWRRRMNGSDHLVSGGRPIVVANVVVQFTRYRDTDARDRSHAPVPEAAVVGAGRLVVLRDHATVSGTWSKASADAAFVYRDATGSEVSLAPGRTWIVLAPAESYATMRVNPGV